MKSTSIDNPFAVPKKKPGVRRSLKTLLAVAACLVAVLGVQFASRYWLLRRLTADWENQPVAVRLERLGALAELDDAGRTFLVQTLLDPDSQVARRAYDRLLEQQADWVTLPDEQADAKHRQLIEALAGLKGERLESRRGWIASLLNVTITETVEHDSEHATVAYALATDLLAKGQRRSDAEMADEASSVQIALRTDELPLDLHPRERREAGRAVVDADDQPLHVGRSADSVDGTNGNLQSVPERQRVELSPLSREGQDDVEADRADTLDAERVVVPVEHLTVAPFETYSTRSVITWLCSVQPKLRDVARSELIRRGFAAVELELAARLADPDIRVRRALLDELDHRSDVDPRPWLLWMAEDAERDIRLRAVTILATMPDSNIRKQLRVRLQHESDPAVVSLLRRVLTQR